MSADNCIKHSYDCLSCVWNFTSAGCRSYDDCKTCPNAHDGRCNCLADANDNDEHCPYYKKEAEPSNVIKALMPNPITPENSNIRKCCPEDGKQIQEMANDYYEAMLKARGTLGSMNDGAPKWYAKELYAKGYRKASEVLRDIFNDLNEMWHKGRGFINYYDLVKLERLHEQKYTEDTEDTK